MDSVLSLHKIKKNYGPVKALDEITFDVPKGAVFGILGPNGSGKTTLLSIVMDIVKATQGNFYWNGEKGSSAAMRRQIGTLLETPNFYHYLNAVKNLKIAAAIKEKDKGQIDEVLQKVNLYQRRFSKFNTYSLGMKQRLAIASTLLGNPDILVFDEPTNGLDPAGIAEIRDLIKALSREGKTIIMASHILDEVEKVCTHVAIIQNGVLKTSGSIGEVLNATTADAISSIEIEIGATDLAALQAVLQNFPGLIKQEMQSKSIMIQVPAEVLPATINRFCFDNGIVLNQLQVKQKSLESRFLEITDRKSDR